jgi:hypothetical protein
MGCTVDFEPLVGVRLVFTDFVADLRMEYFGPTTRHATDTCIDKLGKNFSNRLLGEELEPVNFDSGPSF